MKTDTSFDPAIHQKKLLHAWRELIATGNIDHAVVPTHIAASWERSYQYNVDPFSCNRWGTVDQKNFEKRRHDRQYLLSLAEPYMERIYGSLDPARYLVVLYDTAGYHLLRMGRIAEFEKISGFHIEGGICFEEDKMGTCGFSLVKTSRKPISIAGCEHYASFMHRIIGSYAPICCPVHGHFLGAIGIAGAATMPSSHALGTVSAAALAIENQIRMDRSRQGAPVTNDLLQTVVDNLSIGVFFTDSSGRISEMNRQAKAVFGLSDANVRGKSVSEAILTPMVGDLFETVRKSRARDTLSATAQIDGAQYVITAQWIGKESNNEAGALFQLHGEHFLADILSEPGKGRLSSELIHKSGVPVIKGSDHTGASFNDIIGLSPRMMEIKNMVRWAARSQANVILEGESGTGKEVLAHVIHNESARKTGPFVVIHCSAIPSQLMESILFGHEKGSFTDAIQTRIGKFELANGGTILLDEIGDMPQDMQMKLLRVLEDRTIERIGGKRPIEIDIRIIAATNRNLTREVKEGRFRDDLFYRLNVLRIVLPPLRDRKDEIYHLVPFFVRKISPLFDKKVDEISTAYYNRLISYSWPGNIRELRNAVEYSIAIVDGPVLLEEHALGFFRQASTESPLPQNEQAISGIFPHQRRNLEEETIQKAIEEAKGNKLKAARNLSISRATLYRYLKKQS
jgi:sigma-54 dependent transcriptional regulator, acetoin dehydrogenase operon transcriptional activator AcoR